MTAATGVGLAPADQPDGAGRPGGGSWLRRHWYGAGLGSAVVLAATIRIVNVLVWRPTCIEDIAAVAEARGGGGATGFDFTTGGEGCFGIAGDAAYGYLQGRLIGRGQWFVDSYAWFATGGKKVVPSAGDPPLFALVMGFFSRLGITSGTGQRLVCGVFGVLGVLLIALAARRLAGRRTAIVAAVLAAVYPLLWINDGMLLSESLYVPMIALVILAAYRYWDGPGLGSAALLGGAIALAALTRAEAILLFLLVPLPLLIGLRRTPWVRRLLQFAVCCGVGVLLIGPWIVYNLGRFEEPVFMTSGTGAVLSSANCDTTYYGDYKGYYANCFDEYVAAGDAQWPDPGTLDEAQRDKVSRDAAMRYISKNRSRFPAVMVYRVTRMFDLYNPEVGDPAEGLGQNVRVNWAVEGRGVLATRAGFLAYWLLLPFSVIGGWLLWKRRLPVSPMVAMPLVLAATAALTFGITRYRVPVDAVMVILAAVAVDALLSRRWAAPDPGTVRSKDQPETGFEGGAGHRAAVPVPDLLAEVDDEPMARRPVVDAPGGRWTDG